MSPMSSDEDKLGGATPPLVSAVINWRHRFILLVATLLLISPLAIATLRNKSIFPLFIIIFSLVLFVFWLIFRYEIFFLRRGLSERFLRFYSLQELFREEMDLYQMAGKVCEWLEKWLNCKKVYFYLINEVLNKCQVIARIDPESWSENSIPLNDFAISSLVKSQSAISLPVDSGLWINLGFRFLVPVRTKGKLAGFIALGEKRNGEPYYRIELKNLEILATQLGLFLEKEEYRKTLRRQLKELTSAQEILTRMVSNPYYLDSVLESLVEDLRLLFPQVRLIEICLWDEKERKMVARKVSGVGIVEGYKYDLGEGLSGLIARDRRSILIKDVQALKEKPKIPDAGVFRSFVGVPLIYQDKLIGSLEMDSFYPEAFGMEDLRFLESLAPYFAAIIHNTQVHYSMVKEKEALLEAYNLIGKMLASGLKGEELLVYISKVVNAFMDAEACAIRIWEGGKALTSYCAGSESILPPPRWEIDLCSRQDEVIIQELGKQGEFSDARGMKAFMGASIHLRGEKIGWIGVWKREPKDFSPAEMNWLKAFSAQVALIWEKILFQKELEKTRQYLGSLHCLKAALEGVSSFRELASKALKVLIDYYKLERIPCCLLFFASTPEDEPALAMSPGFSSYFAELLAFFAPKSPVESRALESLKGYLKGFDVLPLEADGKAWGIFVFPEGKIPDITLFLSHMGFLAARLTLKKELEKAEEKLFELLGLVSDGLYLAGKGGEISYIDEKACSLIGFTDKELVGRSLQVLYPEGSTSPLLEATQKGKLTLRTTYLKARDGHLIPVKEAAIPLSPEKTVVAFWDLSREKDLEKVQDVVTIFLVHEIGKLATKLSSALYLYREGKKRRETLDELVKLSDKMTETVRKLQEIINLERGKIRLNSIKLDVTKLAKEVVKRFADGGTHRFSFKEPAESLLALADEKMVEIILSNLLENALKYSPPGSLITVKVEAEGDEVKVSVKDEGEGIPIPLQKKIFEKFYRIETKETAKTSGLGLGLYFCKLIVEAHGGRIWVESSPGHGSTFSFTLPKTQ